MQQTPKAAENQAEPLALYVHWPWCESKCPYCDFNSHPLDRPEGGPDVARWQAAYLSELEHFAALTGPRHLTSIFFGGGTPSLMAPQTVAAVIERATTLWPQTQTGAGQGAPPPLEITLEANPSSVETETFRRFRDAGVNRVSVGVQALDPPALAFLGRRHSVAEARRALETAAATFGRWSFDLIYARPGQAAAPWRRELAEALAMAPDHLSLYQLGIEPGTAFYRTGVQPADEDAQLALYALTQEMTAAAGLVAYEVSNHARPGHESRHNLTYWQGGDYAAIGPGAHSRLRADGVCTARHQVADPRRWLERVGRDGHGTARAVRLAPRARAEELVLAGLRLQTGIGRAAFRARTGLALDAVLNREQVAELSALGLLVADDGGVRATAAGRLVLNTLIARLLG